MPVIVLLLAAEGLFIATGHDPRTELFTAQLAPR